MNRHLDNDDLLSHLYGIGDCEITAHLLECTECANLYAAFERRREESVRPIEVSSGFLATQRRAVYARLEEPHRPARWAPAVAAAFLLALGLLLHWPFVGVVESPGPAHPEISDEQLFSDVYSIEESAEPRAAAPIHGLFESVAPEVVDEGQN